MDTCGSVEITAKQSLQVVRQSRSNGTVVLGVIALEEADVLAEAARVLRRHNIPLIVATPRAAESEAASLLLYAPDDPAVFTQPDNVFSAVPNTAAVARVRLPHSWSIRNSSISNFLSSFPHFRLQWPLPKGFKVRPSAYWERAGAPFEWQNVRPDI